MLDRCWWLGPCSLVVGYRWLWTFIGLTCGNVLYLPVGTVPSEWFMPVYAGLTDIDRCCTLSYSVEQATGCRSSDYEGVPHSPPTVSVDQAVKRGSCRTLWITCISPINRSYYGPVMDPFGPVIWPTVGAPGGSCHYGPQPGRRRS